MRGVAGIYYVGYYPPSATPAAMEFPNVPRLVSPALSSPPQVTDELTVGFKYDHIKKKEKPSVCSFNVCTSLVGTRVRQWLMAGWSA